MVDMGAVLDEGKSEEKLIYDGNIDIDVIECEEGATEASKKRNKAGKK
jgi:hypothetical protein